MCHKLVREFGKSKSHDKLWRYCVSSVALQKMRFIWKRFNNQILGEFKFRFKSSEKKKYLYADKHPANDLRRTSTALFMRLFLSENGRVVMSEMDD